MRLLPGEKEIGTNTLWRTLNHMQTNSPIIEIGKALRQAYWEIAREPVPERWVDLIIRLDAEEAKKGDQSDDKPFFP
jgi:anti-sigma factor NepR-like protein